MCQINDSALDRWPRRICKTSEGTLRLKRSSLFDNDYGDKLGLLLLLACQLAYCRLRIGITKEQPRPVRIVIGLRAEILTVLSIQRKTERSARWRSSEGANLILACCSRMIMRSFLTHCDSTSKKISILSVLCRTAGL